MTADHTCMHIHVDKLAHTVNSLRALVLWTLASYNPHHDHNAP